LALPAAAAQAQDQPMRIWGWLGSAFLLFACGGGKAAVDAGPGTLGDAAPLPAPTCAAAPGGGSTTVAAPTLAFTLADRYQEGWLASPAVADLDGDGTIEIVAPRDDQVIAWHADGSIAWRGTTGGRVWASPVVADLVPSRPGLEVAVASRGTVTMWDAHGAVMPGFPVTWRDELRSLAAGDIDGDGALELVAVTSSPLDANGQRDIVLALRGDGTWSPGFPANTTGVAGCDTTCYVTGGYDQNVALGDVTGDGVVDIVASQDNAYNSVHDGTGKQLDAAPIFAGRRKYSGIRFMHDYALAQQGYANDEAVDLQGHFTNTAPAIADLDGDGTGEIILLGSVQNAAQTEREHGVALWVTRQDGTRPTAWTTPPRFGDFLAGLWDWPDNIVAITNQVSVADLDPGRAGPELVFAGFDGRIHAVDARAQPMWSTPYTTDDQVGTAGIAVADLSGDGVPELVFATYATAAGKSNLFVLDAAGNLLHTLPLPGRGAMAVPTIADVDGDGVLDIVVNLKDAEDRVRSVLIYRVPGASANCLPWPTGRGDLRRDGFVPPPRP
jgi:hypothetical protein